MRAAESLQESELEDCLRADVFRWRCSTLCKMGLWMILKGKIFLGNGVRRIKQMFKYWCIGHGRAWSFRRWRGCCISRYPLAQMDGKWRIVLQAQRSLDVLGNRLADEDLIAFRKWLFCSWRTRSEIWSAKRRTIWCQCSWKELTHSARLRKGLSGNTCLKAVVRRN